MKKYIALTLIFCYLFSTTELSQVFKLPFLIEHYHEVQAKGQKVSFVQFIKSHYFNKESQDKDRECDNKLPFKKHDICNGGLVLLQEVPKTFTIVFERPLLLGLHNRNFIYKERVNATPFFSIFTPPKIG